MTRSHNNSFTRKPVWNGQTNCEWWTNTNPWILVLISDAHQRNQIKIFSFLLLDYSGVLIWIPRSVFYFLVYFFSWAESFCYYFVSAFLHFLHPFYSLIFSRPSIRSCLWNVSLLNQCFCKTYTKNKEFTIHCLHSYPQLFPRLTYFVYTSELAPITAP